MSDTLNATKCPKCGSSLPAKQLEGLCPACLLETGHETATAEDRGRKRFEPPSLEQLAKLFPQLTFVKLLGAGGMGAVYLARQPKLDRFVALKILPPGSEEGVNFEERFNREARALARLSHPNIVAVHEFGQAEGLHYFIMEYVDGANLRQLEQAGRLSPREALQLIPQICDALQYAHDEGVVHRDIKPENVLVDRKGRVKIADFGLAKILSRGGEEARLTVEGQVMGTPHYMAPEQVERPLSVDHRADIYSLGVVFYEMLTGDLPLGKFAPPSRKVSVDVRLDEVVLRALENDPSRRYQHASEVKTHLQNLSEPTAATSQPVAPRQDCAPTCESSRPKERYVYWAGIQLAVDRDGDREITWDGGVKALGAGIILALIGLWLFKVITDLPSPSLTGIPFLVMLLIVGAGFRWALNTPLPESPQAKVTENGTVILEAEPQLGWSVLALASIVPAMILWGFIVSYGFPLLRGQPLPGSLAAQRAKLGKDGVLTARLPNSGTAELLAVAYPNAAPNQWWRPDGSPITNALFEFEDTPAYDSGGKAFRDVVFRLADLPRDASGPFFEVEPQGGYASGGVVLLNNEELPGGVAVRIGVASSSKMAKVRLGLGLTPWRTIGRYGVEPRSTTYERQKGDPDWDFTFQALTATMGGAQVTVIMPSEDRHWKRRLIAVGTNGVDYPTTVSEGTPREKVQIWTYRFDEIPLVQVREFKFQVQPVHWVEFKDLQLHPKQPLPKPDRVTFTSARELRFEDFIDFDTGKIAVPTGVSNENALLGIEETVNWMERAGMDAAASADGLQPLGMVFAPAENGDWTALPPAGVAARLRQGMFRPARLTPVDGRLPSTFVFRTREGGTGIMQLIGLGEADRPGTSVRYKLIQRPKVANQ